MFDVRGLHQSATVYSQAETDDSYGGVTATDSGVITNWLCRVSNVGSDYRKEAVGKGGGSRASITGEPTTTNILAGYIVAVNSERWEVLQAVKQKDEYGTFHHWHLICEKK